MVILVLNCGSSSIKYQVIDMVSPRENSLLAKGLVERIGIEGGIITHKPTGKPRLELTTDIPNHTKGIDLIFKAITDSESGVIASLDDIRAVGHRVAHGGDFFDRSVLVDDEVINRIEQLVEAGPAAQPGQPERYLRREGSSVRPYRRWYVSIRRSTSPCRPAATSMGFPINITSSTA